MSGSRTGIWIHNQIAQDMVWHQEAQQGFLEIFLDLFAKVWYNNETKVHLWR